ncbi:TPA: diguanylate cyclase [Pseudomonas aeruginosa]
MTGLEKVPISLLYELLDALPFGVSWAAMPGARILYSNQAFDELFAYPPGHFQTADQLIDETYIHEHQRTLLREHWNHFQMPQQTSGIIVVPEREVDILNGEGQIRVTKLWGLILPEQQLTVAIYRDVSNEKRYNQTLKKQAFRDPLTGVSNRRGLQERWREVEEARDRPRLAFLMMDLDEFKPINDMYGHQAGDEVLRVIALRLKGIVRQSDLVCRLGGDEFGLLLSAPTDFAQTAEICGRIIEEVSKPIQLDGIEVSLGTSLGGCMYPDHAVCKRELLQRADMALYSAKRSGKGRWRWWSPSLSPPCHEGVEAATASSPALSTSATDRDCSEADR